MTSGAPPAPYELPEDCLAGTPYRFLRILGQGGMGQVVEAEQPDLKRTVVVKFVRQDLADARTFLERMRREAIALARLAHPNVVSVFDFGQNAAGRPFLVMERLEGHTLRDELAMGPILVPRAVDIACQCLLGLQAAHESGLIHRDMKPDNIFICHRPSGLVKLLDFGLAKPIDHEPMSGPQTQVGVVMGTPKYMSPEQVSAALVLPASDLYSLGLVLWEMLVGVHPFHDAGDSEELFRAQLSQLPPPPSLRASQPVSLALDRAVLRALAKRSSDRFASAQEMDQALRAALDTTLPHDAMTTPRSMAEQTTGSEAVTREARPAPARWSRRVIVLLHVLPAVDLVYRLVALIREIVLLVRPLGVLPAPASEVPDQVRHAVESAAGIIFPVELVRGLLFIVASIWLLRIARKLARGADATGELRQWAWAAFAVLVLSLVMQGLLVGTHLEVANALAPQSGRASEIVQALLPIYIIGYILIATVVYLTLPLWVLWKTVRDRSEPKS